MRPTAIRRTAVAATVMSLALLTAACGSDGDAGKDNGKASDSASAKPADKGADKGADSTAKALTAAELEKVSLAQGDVKDHRIAKATPADAIEGDAVTVDKAACDVFADVLMGARAGKPAAFTQRKVAGLPKKSDDPKASEDPEKMLEAMMNVTTTLTTLQAYDGKGADEALAGLRTAATECASGFTLTAAGAKQKVTKIAEVPVKGGEEAVAWTVTVEGEGEKYAMKLIQLRQGTTLASLTSLNLSAAAEGGDFELPTAVIDAQVAKLA
ncbi:hypothetical protein ACIBM4_10380 [Streptomyces sp. NPDC050256]|uniref:hypothetical protein n=1 Tax=Streptomyces sp. NPDC050256 TaxID=3365607 RepID=UPI0037B4CAAD